MSVIFLAVCASAQVYVGGSLGLNYEKYNGTDDGEMVYSIIPEVGYKMNGNWAVGVALGYSHGNFGDDNDDIIMGNTFKISPYARYTFLHCKMVNVFCDGAFDYAYQDESEVSSFAVGLKPGVELVMDKFSLVAHVVFLGYKHNMNNLEDKVGLDLDGNGLSIGLFYNF